MKTRLLFCAFHVCVVAAGLVPSGQAQWAPCGTGGPVQCAPSGNVGIGTTTPRPIGDGGTPTVLQVHGGNGAIPFGILELTTSGTAQGSPVGALTFGTTGASNLLRTAEIASLVTAPSETYATGNLVFYTANGSGGTTEKMRITEAGNVGIGTTSPGYALDVVGATRTLGTIQPADTGYEWFNMTFTTAQSVGNYQLTHRKISDGTWTNALTILASNNNVGIGTTNPTHKLTVNGPIRAKEIIVDTGWSDYVFRPQYRLRPLSEVAAYIRTHQHLPDIPSEAEVSEKGVSVGDMQAKLLAKIEELTLHMIEEHERNERLELRNGRLEEQNRALSKRMASLESRIATGTAERNNK